VASHTHLDLTSPGSVRTLSARLPRYRGPAVLVVSVRPPLVAAPTRPRWLGGGDSGRCSFEHDSGVEEAATSGGVHLVAPLEALVHVAAGFGVQGVLHVSSIAAADHLRPQVRHGASLALQTSLASQA
jgi:hypothetical protein